MRLRSFTFAAMVALLALAPSAALGSTKSAATKTAAGSTAKKAGAKSAAAKCAGDLGTLYPVAPGSDRFTMVFRINTIKDVNAYANADETMGGLKPRVRDRDIFLINTRFKDSDAADEQTMATKLRQVFPCNRIFALNGLSFNALSEGYMFSLLNAPEVSALLLDWEKLDWDVARSTDAGMGPWIDSPFYSMLPQLKRHLSVLANTIVANGAGKRIGLAPFARADWNLGIMARTIDRQAARIVPGGRGFQSSQTQKTCQAAGGAGLQSAAKTLFTQYKKANFKKIKRGKGKKPKFKRLKPRTQKLNLGIQISFTAFPQPGHPDPVKSVGPAQAAACTMSGLFQKAGAILYWARPEDMDALFSDPRICAMRPSRIGIC